VIAKAVINSSAILVTKMIKKKDSMLLNENKNENEWQWKKQKLKRNFFVCCLTAH